MKSFLSLHKTRERALISLLALMNLCITVPLAAILNIWIDESYTINTTSRGVVYAIQQSLQFEYQPPMYFLLLTLWRNLGDSIFFLRLFSILCVFLMLFISAVLSRKLLQNFSPVWTVLLVASNPFVIWAAVEMRVYALGLLLSCLQILCFYEGFVAIPRNKRARQLHIFLAIFSLYTIYYLGFLLVIHAVILLFLRRWNELKSYLWQMLIAGIFFSPLLGIMKQQVTDLDSFFITGNSTLSESFVATVRRFQWFIFGTWSSQNGFWWVWNLLVKPLMLIGSVIIGIYNSHLVRRNHVAIWMMCGVGFSIFVSLRYLTGMQYAFAYRHISVLFLPLVLSVCSILSLSGDKKFVVVPTVVAILLFSYSFSLFEDFSSASKPGDWRRVAEHLISNEEYNQNIIVFPPDIALSLSYYYSGKNAVVQIPREIDLENYDPRGFVLKDLDTVRGLLAKEGTVPRIWLVTIPNADFFFAGGLNSSLLEAAVDIYFEVESTREFNQSSVRLLRAIPSDSERTGRVKE